MTAPDVTLSVMSSDLERLHARAPAASAGAGPAVVAAELLGRIRAELPVVGGLGEREQVLVAAWLTGLRSARTRRAYAGDVAVWLGWLDGRDTDVLAAGRVHVDLWASTQLDEGAAASSVRRRLSALSSFYRYCAACDLTGRVPTQGVARPVVDPDYTATVGLDRDQARALVADADAGAQALRTAAVVRLLHNALRVDEACAAGIADLGEDYGHRVLRVVRKAARKAKIPLTPATVAVLEAYLADRAQRAGVTDWRQLAGPLLATVSDSLQVHLVWWNVV
jgi:integrase/recombinase XerD